VISEDPAKSRYTILYARFIHLCTQQNGVSERKNRTLVGAILSMLSHAKLPKVFWGEAIICANYLQNRNPAKAIPKKKHLLNYGLDNNQTYLILKLSGVRHKF